MKIYILVILSLLLCYVSHIAEARTIKTVIEIQYKGHKAVYIDKLITTNGKLRS